MNVQTDRMLAEFFQFLDKQVGLSHCIVVLTADHGVSPIPSYVNQGAGRTIFQKLDTKEMKARAESLLTARFRRPQSGKWIESFSGGALFISPAALAEAGITAETAAGVVCDDLRLPPRGSRCLYARTSPRNDRGARAWNSVSGTVTMMSAAATPSSRSIHSGKTTRTSTAPPTAIRSNRMRTCLCSSAARASGRGSTMTTRVRPTSHRPCQR